MTNECYLMICGSGESGKDELAKILKKHLPEINYKYPTSYYCIDIFYEEVQNGIWTNERLRDQGLYFEGYYPNQYGSKETFYESRRYHRDIWGYWVKQFNKDDPIKLYQLAIDKGERVFVGLRKVKEYDSFREKFPNSFSIWVQRDSVKHDPTQEYGPDKCDFIIQNNGTIEELENKVKKLVSFFMKEMYKNLDSQLNEIDKSIDNILYKQD